MLLPTAEGPRTGGRNGSDLVTRRCVLQMAAVMDTFRVGDDLPIESPLVSENLDKVQMQVESYYYDIRQKVRPFWLGESHHEGASKKVEVYHWTHF